MLTFQKVILLLLSGETGYCFPGNAGDEAMFVCATNKDAYNFVAYTTILWFMIWIETFLEV